MFRCIHKACGFGNQNMMNLRNNNLFKPLVKGMVLFIILFNMVSAATINAYVQDSTAVSLSVEDTAENVIADLWYLVPNAGTGCKYADRAERLLTVSPVLHSKEVPPQRRRDAGGGQGTYLCQVKITLVQEMLPDPKNPGNLNFH